MERIAAERGSVDVLVNNAGLTRDELFPVMSTEAWDDVVATNLGGVFHCCRAVVRRMIAKKAGVPVTVLGETGSNALTLVDSGTISVADLKATHEAFFPDLMSAGS